MNKYNVQLLQIKRMNYQFIPTGIKYVRFGACRVVDAPGQDVSLLCFSGEQNGARVSRQESARGDVSLTDRFVKGIFHQKKLPLRLSVFYTKSEIEFWQLGQTRRRDCVRNCWRLIKNNIYFVLSGINIYIFGRKWEWVELIIIRLRIKNKHESVFKKIVPLYSRLLWDKIL